MAIENSLWCARLDWKGDYSVNAHGERLKEIRERCENLVSIGSAALAADPIQFQAINRPELWISSYERAVVLLCECGGECVGVGDRKLALQGGSVPDVLACRHFD